jgi:tetratricopeptide (TPR) repeat protein
MTQQVQQILEGYRGLIVIGHSGNDKSIIKLLKTFPKGKNLYWCAYKKERIDKEVEKLLNKKGGCVVKTNGFNELMDQIRKIIKISDYDITDQIDKKGKRLRKLLDRFEIEEKKSPKDEIFDLINAIFGKGTKEDKRFIKPYLEFIISSPTRTTVHSMFVTMFGENASKRKKIETYLQKLRLSFPDNAGVYALYGTFLSKHDPKNPKAEEYLKIATELKPHEGQHYFNLASLYEKLNRLDEALENAQKAYDNGWQGIDIFLQFATLHKKLGNVKKSKEFAEIAENRIDKDDFYDKVCIYSILDDKDKALDNLDKAVKKEAYRKEWAKSDPDLKWIRNDPRFKEIVGK